jgi:4-amino-4-deoxy-L-arabinose transferase-like glycosyltransferase
MPVGGGDPNIKLREALDELDRGFWILLLWIVLAILLFRGGNSRKMPPQALMAAAILLPLSGVAAFYAADLYARYAGWAIVVPALLPALIALYAM